MVRKKMKNTKKIKKLLPFLQTMKEMRPAHRTIMLNHLDDESAENICEAAANVLRNDNLTQKQKTRLRRYLNPHKSTLRYITKKQVSIKNKKKKLSQIGGNPLSFILSTAIPLLLSVL